MCKGPVAKGNMMPGLRHDQNLGGCQERVRRDEVKELAGLGLRALKPVLFRLQVLTHHWAMKSI